MTLLNAELGRHANNLLFQSLYFLAAIHDYVYILLEACYMPDTVLRSLRIQGPTLKDVSGSRNVDRLTIMMLRITKLAVYAKYYRNIGRTSNIHSYS